MIGRTYTDDDAHGLAQRHYRLAYELAEIELDRGNPHAARAAYQRCLDQHHVHRSPSAARQLARLRSRLVPLTRPADR
ncbi:hypothetical protein [Streptomyces sp. NBC_00454]|uniref:hypothetical protein n=1 Tax=Streptomyces sp. NBC_00454 TaxID=2975747 RepID=UPI0030E16AF7